MTQMMPIGVYFVAQRVLTPENLGGVVPKEILGWLPMLAAILTYFVSNHFQSQAAAQANAKVLGQEAPDFDCELDGKKTTLLNIVKEKGLPTVIDFYQSF